MNDDDDDYDGFHYNDDDNAFGSKGRLGKLEFEWMF
jgi:hypothetical protein